MESGGGTPVPWGDYAFALLVIAAAGLVWFGTADLPPPRYEPVGSAALPRGIAAVMALLAIVVAVRARGTAAPAPADSGPGLAGPLRVLALGTLMVVFVLVMETRQVSFRPAAAVFLFLTAAVLGGLAPRRLAGYAAFAVVLSLGLHAVFTRLFYIDLP